MTTYTCPEGHTSAADDYCDVCGAPIAPAAGGAVSPAASPAASPAGSPAGSVSPPPLVPPSGVPAGGPAPVASGGGSSLDLDVPAPSGAGTRECPNCGAVAVAGALFCEDCGFDFTTNQMPRPSAPPAVPELAPLGPPAGAPGGEAAGPVEWVVEVWVDPDWHAAQDAADPCPSPGMPVVVPLVGTSLLVGRTSVSRNIHPQVDIGTDTGVSRRHAQLTTDGQRWWVEDLQSANGTYVGPSGGPLPTKPVTPGQRVELADDDRVYLGAWSRLVIRAATPQEQAGTP